MLLLEALSVILNILFLVLFTKEIKLCWVFGILGSLLGAILFYYQKYYSETLLYLFYTGIGFYAYRYWNVKENETFTIKPMSSKMAFTLILSTTLLALGLGFIMTKTDADKPYLDALSTVFGIIATFLEIYKYLAAWLFWIAINAFTVWLYGIKELNFFAFQMIIYTLLSIRGYWLWSQKMKSEKAK